MRAASDSRPPEPKPDATATPSKNLNSLRTSNTPGPSFGDGVHTAFSRGGGVVVGAFALCACGGGAEFLPHVYLLNACPVLRPPRAEHGEPTRLVGLKQSTSTHLRAFKSPLI